MSLGDIGRIQNGELDESEAVAAATPRADRSHSPEKRARRNRRRGRIAAAAVCVIGTVLAPPMIVVFVPLFILAWILINKIMPIELATHQSDRVWRLPLDAKNRLDEDRIAELERDIYGSGDDGSEQGTPPSR